MNIQIFSKPKCFDSKKAERYFKERNISFQAIDLKEKGISKGELKKVVQAFENLEDLMDEKTKQQEAFFMIRYLAEEEKFEKILENPMVLKTPIVRNGTLITVGFQPDIWKQWK